MSIVIVEDNPMMGEALLADIQALFGEYFDPIHLTDDPAEGIALIEKVQPKVALLDIKLGDDSKAGIKIAERLTGKTPFIFISGLPDVVGIQNAKHTLPTSYLRKPYTLSSLKDAITLAEAHYESMPQKPGSSIIFSSDETLIWVTSGRNKKEQINLQKLVFLEVSDHYLYAHLSDKERPVMFLSSLSDFHSAYLAGNKVFFKLRNNLIINIRFMERMENNMLFLSGSDTGYPIPRNKKEALLALLESIGQGTG